MTLVANYTYRINLKLEANTKFLFVNYVDGMPDWKSSKLGRGLNFSYVTIGGGNIPVVSRGEYVITLLTTMHPTNPLFLNMTGLDLAPAVTLSSLSFVTSLSLIPILVNFTEPVSTLNKSTLTNAITLSGATLVVDSLVQYSTSAYAFNISAINPTTSHLIYLMFKENIVVDLDRGNPNTPNWWNMIYEPIQTKGKWEPISFLRDDSNHWTEGKPLGGWVVTAIHGNLIAETGEVLLTGWGRTEEFACKAKGSRRMGVSFRLHPNQLTFNANFTNTLPAPANNYVNSLTWSNITYLMPIDEAYDPKVTTRQVLYCAGHTPLRDGRKFYTGGAQYVNLSTAWENEQGVDYARIFDLKAQPVNNNRSDNKFQRVPFTMPISNAWYPTNRLLPDGKVLVTGGFSQFTCGGPIELCTNPALVIFDPVLYDMNTETNMTINPWIDYIPINMSTRLIEPGVKDYTRMFVLPQPLLRALNNVTMIPYEVAMYGRAGQIVFFSLNRTLPMTQRWYIPSASTPGPIKNNVRPTNGGCSDDSSSVLIGTGEILILGGCSSSNLDLYNYQMDRWETIDTGIPRNTPSTVLLPDGTVLLMNGENPNLDQSAAPYTILAGDPRHVQIFDPYTRTFKTDISHEFMQVPRNSPASSSSSSASSSFNINAMDNIPSLANPSTAPFRGYHNMVLLLKDGRILSSGGIHSRGDVGCEQPTLRIYNPPYLNSVNEVNANNPASIRPTFINATDIIHVMVGRTLHVTYSNANNLNLHVTRGAALMGVGAFTHAYDHHQKYVPLPYADEASRLIATGSAALFNNYTACQTINFTLPTSPAIIPGQYILYLLSKSSIPSVGVHVRVWAEDEVTNNPWLAAGIPRSNTAEYGRAFSTASRDVNVCRSTNPPSVPPSSSSASRRQVGWLQLLCAMMVACASLLLLSY